MSRRRLQNNLTDGQQGDQDEQDRQGTLEDPLRNSIGYQRSQLRPRFPRPSQLSRLSSLSEA